MARSGSRAVVASCAFAAACGGEEARSAPKPEVAAKPVVAKVESVSTFRVLAKDERARIAAELASDLRAQVDVDFAGFAKHVVVQLPASVAEADQPARVLEYVRAHPKAFGVRDASALNAERDGTIVRIGEGSYWTGQVAASFDGAKLDLYDHLWPIASAPVATAGAEPMLKPFFGLEGSYRSKCLPGCGHPDQDFVISRQSFELVGTHVLECTGDGMAKVRAVISLRRTYQPGSRVDGMDDKLPYVVDAQTLQPVTGTFWAPTDSARTNVNAARPEGTPAVTNYGIQGSPSGCLE